MDSGVRYKLTSITVAKVALPSPPHHAHIVVVKTKYMASIKPDTSSSKALSVYQ